MTLINLFFVYLFSLAFDFPGQKEGGVSSFGVIQMTSVLFSLIAAICILFFLNKDFIIQKPRKELSQWILLFKSIIAWTLLISVLNFNPPENFLRSSLPYLFCLMSMLIVRKMIHQGYQKEVILFIVLAISLVNVFFRLYSGLNLRGTSELNRLRFSIVGAGLHVLLGYGISGLGFDKRLKLRYVFSLFIYLFIIVLSLSRTYILVFIFLPFFIFLFCRRNFKFKRLLIPFIFAPFLVIVTESVYPSAFEDFFERFAPYTEKEQDVNALTRLDEIEGKFKLLQEDVWPFFLGRGWGWASNKPESFYVTKFANAEHNFFFTPIFNSGIFFGLLMLCFPLSVVIRGTRNFSPPIYSSKDLVFYWTFVIAAFSCFSSSFTVNPFTSRFFGALFGVVAGLLCWPRSKQG